MLKYCKTAYYKNNKYIGEIGLDRIGDLFSEQSKNISQDQTVGLETLIVPYLDQIEDGNDNTASLKWAIIGAYSKKDTAQLQSVLIDYQTNIGPLDSHNLFDLVKHCIKEHQMHVDVISFSDKPSALSDLATWNGEVNNEMEALEWLIKRDYDIAQFDNKVKELYTQLVQSDNFTKEAIEYSEGLPSREDAVIWLVKHKNSPEEHKVPKAPFSQQDLDSVSLKKDFTKAPQGKKHSQKSAPKKDHWDDEHWDNQEGTVYLMRSAAVQKLRDIEEYQQSTIKELISDGPIAASMATGSPVAMVLTAIGVTIATLINKAKNDTETEYLEILESLARFSENKKDPEVDAVKVLKQDVARLNIKLSGTHPASKEDYKKAYPTLISRARKEGYLPNPDLTSQRIEEAGKSLLHIKDQKNIAKNLLKSIQDGSAYAWDCLVDSVKEWRHPLALFEGSINGSVAMASNVAHWVDKKLNISDKTEKHKRSKIAIEKVENHIITIKEQTQTKRQLPIAELLDTDMNIQDLEVAKEATKLAHQNIVEYQKRQTLNHVNFGLAGGLTVIAGVDTAIRLHDLAASALDVAKAHYASDPTLITQTHEMLSNAVSDNWVGVLSNTWGILLGGVAAMSATGKKLHHDTTALRSEFSKVEQNLESVLRLEKEIRQIHSQQIQKTQKERQQDAPTND